MEFVAIIKMSQSTADDLNHRTRDGLQIIGEHGFKELNNSELLHGRIQSRVFYALDVNPNEEYKVILGKQTAPDAEIFFTIPNDREYEIIDFPDI